MKKYLKYTMVTTSIVFLAACGGGGGGGTTQSTKLNIAANSITQQEFVALTPTQGGTQNASLFKSFLNAIFPNAYAALETESELVAITDEVVQPVFNKTIPIKNFSIPSNARTGTQLIAASGDFSNLTTTDGANVQCNVIVARVDGGDATCVYKITTDESTVIPVAVIRDGNVDGYYKTGDSVYFVVNKKTGGYSVYRYLDGNVASVSTKNSGQITKMLVGDRSFYGFNENGQSSAEFIFGNAERGIDTGSAGDRIARYKGYITFPRLDTPYGIRSAYFLLDTAQSLGFSADFSIDCDNPQTLNNIAQHTYGAFWISTTGSKLCETYELVNRPEPIAFRIVNQSVQWSAIGVSDNVFVGIASVGGVNTLVIQDVEQNLQSLTSTRTITLTQALSQVDLDEAYALQKYAGGIVITGTKGSQVTTRYYNTKLKQLETFAIAPPVLSNVTQVPYF